MHLYTPPRDMQQHIHPTSVAKVTHSVTATTAETSAPNQVPLGHRPQKTNRTTSKYSGAASVFARFVKAVLPMYSRCETPLRFVNGYTIPMHVSINSTVGRLKSKLASGMKLSIDFSFRNDTKFHAVLSSTLRHSAPIDSGLRRQIRLKRSQLEPVSVGYPYNV